MKRVDNEYMYRHSDGNSNFYFKKICKYCFTEIIERVTFNNIKNWKGTIEKHGNDYYAVKSTVCYNCGDGHEPLGKFLKRTWR